MNDTIARVHSNGAILLGSEIVADGFYRRAIRVVTHAHHDHMGGLRGNIRVSSFIVATSTTLMMLEALGYKVPEHKSLPLSYGRKFMYEEEMVSLHYSRHIAGSAQVLVEGANYRVGYTGDFKMPGTEPLEDLDVLVLDATYGNPYRQRRWSDWEALLALIGLIDERIKYGPVWIYAFNGKLQEIMVELRRNGVEYPFYASPTTIKLAKIASEFYKTPIGEIHVYNGGPIDESAIVFVHSSRRKTYSRLPGTHVVLTGWEMRGIAVQTGPNSFNVSYSDHATLKEIVEYVREARPKRILVDAYRGKESAVQTARYLERLLDVEAKPSP